MHSRPAPQSAGAGAGTKGTRSAHRNRCDGHRLGDDVVNFYVVEHARGLVLVDAGLPGHLHQLRAHLASSGRSLGDVRAVLLTHGHPDHTGPTGPTGPTLVCRGFTHDGAAALASLDRLDEFDPSTVLLPGHGLPFTA